MQQVSLGTKYTEFKSPALKHCGINFLSNVNLNQNDTSNKITNKNMSIRMAYVAGNQQKLNENLSYGGFFGHTAGSTRSYLY